jgi:hypothetical protein
MRILPALLLAALSACSIAHAGGNSGSGARTGSEVRDVPDFRALETSGSWDVEVEVGPATHVEVIADDDVRAKIRTVVKKHTLHIDSAGNFSTHHRILIKITTPHLDAVASSGSGGVDVDGVSDTFAASVAGSGDLTLDGTLEQLSVAISGSGSVAARKAPAQSIAIQVAGSGSAEVSASQALAIAIDGSGSVDYWGSPQVTKAISGSGSVHKH